jgi:hypothetical protein
MTGRKYARERTVVSGGASAGPDQAAHRGQYKSVLDLVQGYAALIELEGQQAVRTAQVATGSRRVAVGFQNLAHVVFPA